MSKIKMSDYKLIQRVNEDTVILSSEYGEQLWRKIRLRKDTICADFKQKLRKGELAYRPLTNINNRMHRLSITSLIIKEQKKWAD